VQLFTKIYGVVLVLFVVVVSFIALKVSSNHIAETERLLIDKHRLSGSLAASEIQRWQAEGKWPFEALRNLASQSEFLFWWITDDQEIIHLADKVEYVGTDSGDYFAEVRDLLQSPGDTGNIALGRVGRYGIYHESFSVGTRKWSFWLGFSTSAMHKARNKIVLSTLFYSLISLAFLGAVLYVIVRQFLKPLRNLSQGVQRIGKGDLDYRVKTGVRDEIGIVAGAFNQMAESLQKDIREREQVQEELTASFERFKTVLDSIDGLIYVADMDSYELLFVNKYGRDIWGDIAGKTCWKFLQSDQTGPCPFCTNSRLTDDEGAPAGTYVWEFQNTVKGRWYECHDQAIRWTDGRLVRMEIATDITQRKTSESALAEEKERLAVTLRSIGDGVITTDCSGNIVLLNKIAESLTGWTNEEAAGRNLEEVFHIINEQSREVCENPVTKVVKSGQIVELENHTVLVAKDGRERSIADSGAPILDAQSRIIGVVLVFRDVTEQIKTEKELLKVKKLESIGVLAGGIAHDFNNILAAILGNINLALFDEDLGAQTKNLLAEAEKASVRAKDLTQQLLVFAKGGEPVKETASLESVIKDSANFVLHGDKVACRFDIPEDLWLVEIDRGQVSQVVQNIVLNASHAMPEGGVIRVTCENLSPTGRSEVPFAASGGYVRICIEDDGIGMPAGIVEKVFDPYFSTKQEGSGLGLAIAQSIITKHDGHITVDSSPGAGTTFTIYLPASEKTVDEKQRESSAAGEESARLNILVMDDEVLVRNVARKMLSQLGHEVELSEDGGEAVRLYREAVGVNREFDLVIMDLTVPGGMGGKEAVQEILKINPEAKVIVSSGYSNDPIMANFGDHGYCSAIVKPYRVQELVEVISQVVG
jgi:PAS domain S-box-containing protein